MNRRDFLALRVTPQGKTLELSCHGLYMRSLDVQSLEAPAGSAPDEQPAHFTVFDHEPWMGEPPVSFAVPTADDLLAQLSIELAAVQRLRLLEPEWLDSTDLGHRLTPLLAAFRARGGEVMLEQSG